MDATNERHLTVPVRQSTRTVTAARRQEMAAERARILGRKRNLPTPIEAAAAQWEKEQQAPEKRAAEKSPSLSRAAEEEPFSVQRAFPDALVMPADDEHGWRAYSLPQPEKPRARRTGGIRVSSFAKSLIRQERSGGSRAVADAKTRAMEEAARRWADAQITGNLGR